jgi:hypothetical protein
VHLMDAAAAAAASNAAAVAAATARGPPEQAQLVPRRQCWPSRLVQTLDEDDNVLKTYLSQKQAARSIGTSQSGVSPALRAELLCVRFKSLTFLNSHCLVINAFDPISPINNR